MPCPYRYPWPSSQLSAADMRLLHDARESRPDHLPITVLVAQAIRAQFGHLVNQPDDAGQAEREASLRPAA